jgi:hypothetical protein
MAKSVGVSAYLKNRGIVEAGLWLLLIQIAISLQAQTWTSNNAPTFSWIGAASSADGSRLAAIAFGSPVYISPDGGATWNATTSPSNNWTSVASSADGSVLIAACSSTYVSTNSGETWRFAKTIGDRVACSADGQILFSLPTSGGLIVSTNKGDNWSAATTLPPQTFGWTAIGCPANGSRTLAVSRTGALYASSDLGKTWTSNSVPGARWSSIACSADGTKWVVAAGMANGQPGPIYFSMDGATNWNPADAPITNWVGLCCSADGRNLFASTASDGPLNGANAIYRSTNFGANWTRLSAPTPWWMSIAASADAGRLVIPAVRTIYTAQLIQPPALNILSTNGVVSLSWIMPSTNFVLQQSVDLAAGNWTEATETPSFDPTTLQQSVTVPATAANSFYRMMLPP